MRASVIQGIIRRRILLNFRVDPEVVQRHLPHPFEPKLVRGRAIAGVCLIRLERIRPRVFGLPIGISSENAAHRVAVVWTDEQGNQQEGVYIPRRDTNSIANHLAGGRLFPGEHHKASFQVKEADGSIDLQMKSDDGLVSVEICGCPADALPPTSIFASIDEASAFFERGCYGYSATRDGGRLDGVCLHTDAWAIRPLAVSRVFSSYLSDETLFPPGSVAFDCALLMENVPHEWRPLPSLRTRPLGTNQTPIRR